MAESALSLVERLRATLAEHEAWARAASRVYPYADVGATVPEGGVHWRWVHGDNWDTTNPDPAVDEFVGGEPGAPVNLATVEEWPSSSRLDDGTVIHTRMMPESYANEIVEMDAAAAGLIQRYDPAHVLRTVAAHRKIIEEHAPILAMVEWPHDQNGKGEAMVCPRCQNADHTTNWHPPVGGAGVLPEGFIAPYILAPCNTLLALAAVYFPEAPDA